MKEFLLYTSAGLNSNVAQWASSPDRSYDIWITNYSDTPNHLREFADVYNESKGAKFPNLKKIFEEHGSTLSRYKAIMVADDDIIISPKKLNALFRMIEEKDAWIVTPAFSKFGKISHTTTERRLMSKYRYTNFAEVTCPIFRTDMLLSFMQVYDPEIKGYGVDWWYLNHLGTDVRNKIIISDQHYCINPRDFKKSGGRREIDKVSTVESRTSKWDQKKRELGIDSFPKQIYTIKNRSLIEILLALPSFFAEQIYAFLLDGKALAKVRHLLKKCWLRVKSR